MGLLEQLRARLAPAKDKVSHFAHEHGVSHFAHEHGDKLSHGLDKAAKVVDEKTKGKYSDRIHTGTDKAKGAMDRLAHKDEPPAGGGDTFTPPRTPPPAS